MTWAMDTVKGVILAGDTSRYKRVRVRGATPQQVEEVVDP
jgi:uncharacterized protein YggU (UPF0235/DUF167 family)